eukprot:11907695-Karenia_brevis.AAC.1
MHSCKTHGGWFRGGLCDARCTSLCGEDGRPMQENTHMHKTPADAVGGESLAPAAPVGVGRKLGGRCMHVDVKEIAPVTSLCMLVSE